MKGVGVSEGIGVGQTYVLKEYDFDISKKSANAASEVTRFQGAAEALIKALDSRAKKVKGEQSELLESHIMLLSDPAIAGEIENKINAENCNAEYAASEVMTTLVNMFANSGDELLMARAVDLKDIKMNLLATLNGIEMFDVAELPKGTVLVTHELTTSIAAGINPANIVAIVTKLGGMNSHTAIIARSIGVPAVVGVEVSAIETKQPIIVDGATGEIVVNPSEQEKQKYSAKVEEQRKMKQMLEAYRGKKSQTTDGMEVELLANVGLDSDIGPAFAADAEGIGLFRSEFLYMNRTLEPGEEEQFKTYKKAAEVFKGKPVIIRTLDIGGDKEIPYLGLDKEENPFLGWRAVRYCLDKEGIFRTQLRALLRASAFGNIRIMIPMISAVNELVRCREIIESIKVELKEKKIAFNGSVPVGIMIETPAAALIADKLAHHADFFSIGTNDLTQYTIAVDRGNERVAPLYSAYHPAVLRLIYQVIKAANEHNIMSGVCGEAGSDPLIAKFLIGCGIKEISMSPSKILRTRKLVMEKSYATLHNEVEDGLFTVSDVEDAKAFLESL